MCVLLVGEYGKHKLSKKSKIFIGFLILSLFIVLKFFKRSNGASCILDSQCMSGICDLRICRASLEYCGNKLCQLNETCTNCPSDCGFCKIENGGICIENDDCATGHCVHRRCRETDPWCGDKYCDDWENCTSCPSDCGFCEAFWF